MIGIGILVIVLFVVGMFIRYNITGNVVKEDTYKIGVIAPLTGVGANLGPGYVNGIKIGIEEVNLKGGINNKKLEIFVQDGKLEGKESVNAVNYLLNTANPDIYSVLFHLPAQAISPILEKNHKPMIYEAYTRSILDNPYAFKGHFDSLTGCEALTTYAKNNKDYKKLGVLMANIEYGDLCVAGIKKADPNIVTYRYNFGEKDFKTILIKAKSEGVDHLFFEGFDYEYVSIFKELSEGDYNIKVICATASECIFPEVVNSSSENILNGTLSIDVIPLDLRDSNFYNKYSKKYGNPSNTELVFAAVGYEEVQMISKAMEKCNAGDSQCLINELNNVKDYNSLIGSNGFKNRVLQLTPNIYEYFNGQWNLVK